MREGFRCLFRARSGRISKDQASLIATLTPPVNQLQLFVCLLSNRRVPIMLPRTASVEELVAAVQEAQELTGSPHRCQHIEFAGKPLVHGVSLTEYLFQQGSILRETPDVNGGMKCRFEGCGKWIVVGEKYCKQHTGMVDPLSVRKVSLADITLSDTSTAAHAISDGIGNGKQEELKAPDGILLCATDEPKPDGSTVIASSSTAVQVTSTDTEEAPEKMFGDDRGEVAALIQLRDATNYTQWTKNKEGWDLLELGMTGKQAKECKPSGVVFDADGHVTDLELYGSGLSGQA